MNVHRDRQACRDDGMTPSASIAGLGRLDGRVGYLPRVGARVQRRTHDLGAESPSRVLTLAAVVMILSSYLSLPQAFVWNVPRELGWAMAGLVALGSAFTWAARLYLWPASSVSGTAAPTEDHRIVEWVRTWFGIRYTQACYRGGGDGRGAETLEAAGALLLVAAISLRAA